MMCAATSLLRVATALINLRRHRVFTHSTAVVSMIEVASIKKLTVGFGQTAKCSVCKQHMGRGSGGGVCKPQLAGTVCSTYPSRQVGSADRDFQALSL